MNKKQFLKVVAEMDPKEAMSAIIAAVKSLFPLLDEESRINWIMSMVKGAGSDKVASLVHL
jgi:ArsR family metal-binding transcriptional regulator